MPPLALGSAPVLPHQLPHPLARGFPALSASRPAARPCLGQPGSQLSEPMTCASRGPLAPTVSNQPQIRKSLRQKLLGVCVGARLLTSVSARGAWQPKLRAASRPPGPSLCLLFSRKLELCLGRCESLLRVLLISRIFLFSVREVCWKHELAYLPQLPCCCLCLESGLLAYGKFIAQLLRTSILELQGFN